MEALAFEVAAGDALCFDARIVHGSPGNPEESIEHRNGYCRSVSFPLPRLNPFEPSIMFSTPEERQGPQEGCAPLRGRRLYLRGEGGRERYSNPGGRCRPRAASRRPLGLQGLPHGF